MRAFLRCELSYSGEMRRHRTSNFFGSDSGPGIVPSTVIHGSVSIFYSTITGSIV